MRSPRFVPRLQIEKAIHLDDRSSAAREALYSARRDWRSFMSLANQAVWIIERNSERDLTLSGIAKACGVSRSHLANAFGTTTGLSVMHYLRVRRLSEAARVLAGGAPDILSVALDAGYASHEAFTRAFRDRFGMTPERVRERGTTGGLPIVGPFELKPETIVRLEPPQYVKRGVIRIVGLCEPFSWETSIRIPAQWQRFMPYFSSIDTRAAIPVGVCFLSGDEGEFEYICAAEVSRFRPHPPELVEREIPAGTYAVFEHRTHVSKLGETYTAIWNRILPDLGKSQAEAPVLERHNETFDPRTGNGGLTIWIPLAE
jgi:AraC family transcriptional regulator